MGHIAIIALLLCWAGRTHLHTQPGGREPSSSPSAVSEAEASQERLLILRKKALYEVSRPPDGGKWVERKVVDFARTPGYPVCFSGPVMLDSHTALLSYSRDSDRPGKQFLDLYRWRRGTESVRKTGSAEISAGAGPIAWLDSWIASERVLILVHPAGEGMAYRSAVRLRADGGMLPTTLIRDELAQVGDVCSGLGVVAFSADGSFFARSGGRCLAIRDRRRTKAQVIPIEAEYCSALAFSSDGTAIAWSGYVGEDMARELAEEGPQPEYALPAANALGIVSLDTGASRMWRVEDFRSLREFSLYGQDGSFLTVSENGNVIYATCSVEAQRGIARHQHAVGRFDTATQQMEIVAEGIQGFAVLPCEAVERQCSPPGAPR